MWKTHPLGLICPFYDLSHSVISPEDWIEIIHLILVDTEMLSVSLGLVDFCVRLVDFVHYLPYGQVILLDFLVAKTIN